MNKNYTDKELLSAYIDGELSLNEKKLIEDKIIIIFDIVSFKSSRFTFVSIVA